MAQPLTLEKVNEVASEARALAEHLMSQPLPQSVEEVLSGNYAAAGITIGDAWLAHIPREELAEWGKRTMSIAVANDIVAQLEDDLAAAYTNSQSEILVKNAMITIRALEFLAGHAGELAIVAEALIKALYHAAEDIGSGIAEFFQLWFEGKIFGPDDNAEVNALVDKLSEGLVDDFITPVWDALESVVAASLLEGLKVFGSATAMLVIMEPAQKLCKQAIATAKRSALVQRPRKSYRRRKRAR